MGGGCGGSGIYEYRLANLQMRAGRLESAGRTLKRGLNLDTPYKRELRAGLADLKIKKGDVKGAKEAYRKLATDYPDWYRPPQQLGAIEIDLEHFTRAIEHLRRANRLKPSDFTFRNLAIAYHVTGQHEPAVKAMNEAFALDKAAARDADAMLATALSYGRLNKFKVADGILRMLIKVRPEVEQTEKFQKAVRFLKRLHAQAEG